MEASKSNRLHPKAAIVCHQICTWTRHRLRGGRIRHRVGQICHHGGWRSSEENWGGWIHHRGGQILCSSDRSSSPCPPLAPGVHVEAMLLLCSTREGGRSAPHELLNVAQPANSPATGEREGDGEEKEEHLRERSGAPWLREGGGMTASARGSPGCGARVGKIEREGESENPNCAILYKPTICWGFRFLLGLI